MHLNSALLSIIAFVNPANNSYNAQGNLPSELATIDSRPFIWLVQCRPLVRSKSNEYAGKLRAPRWIGDVERQSPTIQQQKTTRDETAASLDKAHAAQFQVKTLARPSCFRNAVCALCQTKRYQSAQRHATNTEYLLKLHCL